MGKQYVYVVWSAATGPIMAYWKPDQADDHRRTMLGVQVGAVEVRTELPDVLRDDVYYSELDDFDEEETPVDDEVPPLPPRPDEE